MTAAYAITTVLLCQKLFFLGEILSPSTPSHSGSQMSLMLLTCHACASLLIFASPKSDLNLVLARLHSQVWAEAALLIL